jgi:hypothetical protein
LKVGISQGELRVRSAGIDVIDVDLSAVYRASAAALAQCFVVAQKVIPHSPDDAAILSASEAVFV